MNDEVEGLMGPREFPEEKEAEFRLNPKFPYTMEPFPFATVIGNLQDRAKSEEEQDIDSDQL